MEKQTMEELAAALPPDAKLDDLMEVEAFWEEWATAPLPLCSFAVPEHNPARPAFGVQYRNDWGSPDDPLPVPVEE